MKPTAEQVQLMFHALGNAKPGTRPYRNYFCASEDSDHDRQWAALVEGGFARLAQGPTEVYPYNVYRVTAVGRELLQVGEETS